MPVARKNARRLPLEIDARKRATPYGGLLLIEALCRRWGLWARIDESRFSREAHPEFGPRTAEFIIAQLLFSVARGGQSLAEAAMLRNDPVLLRLLGIKQAADESTLNTWLAGQTQESLQELSLLNAELVKGALRELCPAKVEDHTASIDIVMRTMEWRNSIGENGLNRADSHRLRLCWRSLAAGPFLLDGVWSGIPGESEPANQFHALLSKHRDIWAQHEAYFSCGDLPDGANWWQTMEKAGFARWTAELDLFSVTQACNFQPDSSEIRWLEAKSDGLLAQHFCRAYPVVHMQKVAPGAVAVARWNNPQSQQTMLRCLVHPSSSRDCPSLWFSRHFAGLEVAAQMCKDLNLQPQFLLKDNAWIAYFTIACMAYNLLTALGIILVPDARWTAREIISGLITTPLSLTTTANEETGWLAVITEWPGGWRELVESTMPYHKRR